MKQRTAPQRNALLWLHYYDEGQLTEYDVRTVATLARDGLIERDGVTYILTARGRAVVADIQDRAKRKKTTLAPVRDSG